ncbi:MAG: hypothetical protein RL701_5526 [Pseudomonadota bacterium]|jgi:CRISPR-associated protein Csb2
MMAFPDFFRSLTAGEVTPCLGHKKGRGSGPPITPFVPPRHIKPRGRNTIQGQVLAELASRLLPTATVELLPWNDETRKLRHFVRARTKKPPPCAMGFALRLTFDEPVSGPLCLGYGSHFGLGLFNALD